MRGNRKTAPKVKSGRVQKKNNWTSTVSSDALRRDTVGFERRRPGRGYRHLLTRSDIARFIGLLPDWSELGIGLHTVVLDAGDFGVEGWHSPGCIAVCAWERELWIEYHRDHYDEHKPLLEALGVPVEATALGMRAAWTESTARAYQLLHVFLHELGHHHDRMTTDSASTSARGEAYAEAYANRYAAAIWEAYDAEFGL